MRTATAVGSAVLTVLACADGSTAPLLGDWGGEHIAMVVTSTGARLEYDCAYGTIDTPIDLGTSDDFVASGTHTFEHGGPIREGEPPDTHPAQYRGWIVGRTMTLTVTVTDLSRTVGTFTLTLGKSPSIFKCR